MTKEEYGEYIKSDQWKKLKLAVYRRDKGKCRKCPIRYELDVHHKTYKRVGKEELSDLILLCRKHHYRAHPKKWLLSLRPSSALNVIDNWIFGTKANV